MTIKKQFLAACAVGLIAVPATASARLDTLIGTTTDPPSAVSSDIQSSAYPTARVVVAHPTTSLPVSFTTDAQADGYRTAPAPELSVVREVHTVTDDNGNNPLAIILASVALCIALMAACFVAVRRRPQVGGSVGRLA